MNEPNITPRQSEALESIRAFYAKNGYQPTFEDIGTMLGITKYTALDLCMKLRRKGLVAWEPGQRRTLRILEIPSAEVAQGEMEVRA